MPVMMDVTNNLVCNCVLLQLLLEAMMLLVAQE